MKTTLTVLTILLLSAQSHATNQESTHFQFMTIKDKTPSGMTRITSARKIMKTNTDKNAICMLMRNIDDGTQALVLETTDQLGNRALKAAADEEVIVGISKQVQQAIAYHKEIFVEYYYTGEASEKTPLVVEKMGDDILVLTLDAEKEAKKAGNLDPKVSSLLRPDVAAVKIAYDSFSNACEHLLNGHSN